MSAYTACEHAGWTESEARKAVDRAAERARLAKPGIRDHWSDLKWGIDENDLP